MSTCHREGRSRRVEPQTIDRLRVPVDRIAGLKVNVGRRARSDGPGNGRYVAAACQSSDRAAAGVPDRPGVSAVAGPAVGTRAQDRAQAGAVERAGGGEVDRGADVAGDRAGGTQRRAAAERPTLAALKRKGVADERRAAGGRGGVDAAATQREDARALDRVAGAAEGKPQGAEVGIQRRRARRAREDGRVGPAHGRIGPLHVGGAVVPVTRSVQIPRARTDAETRAVQVRIPGECGCCYRGDCQTKQHYQSQPQNRRRLPPNLASHDTRLSSYEATARPFAGIRARARRPNTRGLETGGGARTLSHPSILSYRYNRVKHLGQPDIPILRQFLTRIRRTPPRRPPGFRPDGTSDRQRRMEIDQPFPCLRLVGLHAEDQAARGRIGANHSGLSAGLAIRLGGPPQARTRTAIPPD